MNNMKDLIALFDNHKIYDTDIWTNVLILLVFTDLYLGVCCPQKEPGITFQDLTLINLIPFVILGIVCIWTVKFFTCILFALCTLAVPLIGNYIFLFKNEEVSIFTLKEYAMKTNNTVIAQIVSDIEIQKSRKVKSALGKVGAIILCLVDLFAGAFMPKSVPNFLAPSEIVVICIFALLVLLVYSCKIKIQGYIFLMICEAKFPTLKSTPQTINKFLMHLIKHIFLFFSLVENYN